MAVLQLGVDVHRAVLAPSPRCGRVSHGCGAVSVDVLHLRVHRQWAVLAPPPGWKRVPGRGGERMDAQVRLLAQRGAACVCIRVVVDRLHAILWRLVKVPVQPVCRAAPVIPRRLCVAAAAVAPERAARQRRCRVNEHAIGGWCSGREATVGLTGE
eukprot:366130-Chlamydomonas_euryale.AAC.53